jgi:hypothetical protein
MVKCDSWFRMASESSSTTRQAADPLNLRPNAARLEIKRNFFSQREVTDWNRRSMDIKIAPSVKSFKKGWCQIQRKGGRRGWTVSAARSGLWRKSQPSRSTKN